MDDGKSNIVETITDVVLLLQEAAFQACLFLCTTKEGKMLLNALSESEVERLLEALMKDISFTITGLPPELVVDFHLFKILKEGGKQ